uniref:Uncharacterized protein n=1 Tax=Panagrolaimus davidi TaxID=227884 RepID=A0A914PCR0_9BILA
MVDSSQPEILETSVTSSPLIEVQNNLDRDSLSRQRSQSIYSGSETSNQENSIMDPNDSPTPRSKKRKRKSWGKKRGKRVKAKVDTTQDDKEPKEKPPVRPDYWFLVSILVRRMVTKETGKKWTFLSAHDRSKLSANPKTGLLDHPFRISGRPEPFSKESASYCVKYAETVAEYTKKEKEYWKDQDMGPKSHDYERKTIDGKPRKAPPTKEYFQRILGGRPRSYSMTTYTEYEHIYSEKNRLDKPARNNTFFGRRSKSAERVPRSRTRLITTYNMRKFNVPNLNLESQVMFSFLRKYETGKFYQTFSVFWADYHKIVEDECILKGKEFMPPTIYSVIPYEYKRLSSNDEAKIAPDSSKLNLKPWVTDCAEKLLELFKYDVKPLFPVIQPTHEELINHPIINSAAKSKLRQITYETLSLKQWFLNIYNGNEDALKLWEKNKAILFRKRFLENRYFGVRRINELLPKQYRAKTVNQIPDEQKDFLEDQKKWMYDKLGKLREEEEKHRKKEEEKQRKAEIRKLAKEAAKSKIVDNTKKTPIKNNKRKQSVQKGVRAKKPKYSDKIEPNEFDPDDIEFEITAESSKLREREFSPELTASYNSQSESLLLDQSCLSEASALGNSTTFLGEISKANVVEFKEEEITEEISLKLPVTSSAANTYICPKNEAIVCDSLVTKAASKRKTFVEASLKAPRRKGRTKITVEIKKKSKVNAKFVIENKNVDSKFKKPSEKEKAKKIIVMPDEEKIDLSVSEPSLKNVEADIPLFAECISEEAADKLPQDIMPQVEKVSCAINLCKAPVPIRETEKLLQFEEVSTNESDIVKEVEDMTVQQQHIGSDFENTEKESLAMANAEIFEDLPTQKSSDFADLLSENNESILSESVQRNTVKESDDMIVQKQYIGSDLSELVESLIQNVEKQQNISESSASVNTLNQNLFENIEQEPLPMKDAEIFEDLAAQKSSVDLLNVNNESILSESVKNDSVKEAEVEQQHHIIRDLSELVNIGDKNLIENVEKEQNISESSVSVNNQTLFENIEQEPLPMADDEIFEDLAAQKSSVDLLSAYNESILCESVKNDSVKEDIIV